MNYQIIDNLSVHFKTCHMKNLLGLIAVFFMFLPVKAQETNVNLTGTWELVADVEGTTGDLVWILKQQDENITGKYNGMFGEADITGKIKGNEFEVKYDTQDLPGIVYKGKFEGETMRGTLVLGDYASGTFTGKRKKEEKE